MEPPRRPLPEVVAEARRLHLQDSRLSMASLVLVDELDRRRAPVMYNMSSKRFSSCIGLTPNQYWKRVQAARMLRHFPWVRDMVKDGLLPLSSVSLLWSRVTQANERIIIGSIAGKSKPEIEAFLHRLTNDGRIIARRVAYRVRLSPAQVDALAARSATIGPKGKSFDAEEMILRAVDAYIRSPRFPAEAGNRPFSFPWGSEPES